MRIWYLSHMLKVSLKLQWLSGRGLDSRPKGRGFVPHRCHCVVSSSKNINFSLVLVQPKKTHPFITERLLMGCKAIKALMRQNVHRLWPLLLAYEIRTKSPQLATISS